MNILLVNPWIFDFKAFDLWMKPMGLLYLSSILRKNGCNVRLLDCMDRRHPDVEHKVKFRKNGTGKYSWEEVEKPPLYRSIPRRFKRYGISVEAFVKDLLSGPLPDMVLITSHMSYWHLGPFDAIRIINEVFPGVNTILGGIGAFLAEDYYRQNSGASVTIAGRKPENVRDELEKAGLNLKYWPREFSDYPDADFSHYQKLDYGVILSSAGCPYRCSYCASGALWPQISRKKPAAVLGEIKALVRRGVTNIAFYDDALLVDSENGIKPILQGIISEFRDSISFHTPNGLHARYLDRETASLMKRCGFKSICLSLETKNPEIAGKTGGKVNPGQLEWALNNLKEAGFDGRHIAIYLMMGIPGQTKGQVEESLEYVRQLEVQNRLSYFSPVPETPDFDSLAKSFPEITWDPLLHNNTYQFYMGPWEDMATKRELKNRANRYTREILQTLR